MGTWLGVLGVIKSNKEQNTSIGNKIFMKTVGANYEGLDKKYRYKKRAKDETYLRNN